MLIRNTDLKEAVSAQWVHTLVRLLLSHDLDPGATQLGHHCV